MKLSSLFFILVILLSNSCKTTEAASGIDEHPFKVVRATYNNWVGGQPGSKGIHVKIIIDNPSVQLDSIYFRHQKIALSKEEITGKELFIGNYNTPYVKKDMRLSSNPMDEYGNEPPPVISNKKLFDLKDEGAVVNYRYKGKVHYLKIEKLKRTATENRY